MLDCHSKWLLKVLQPLAVYSCIFLYLSMVYILKLFVFCQHNGLEILFNRYFNLHAHCCLVGLSLFHMYICNFYRQLALVLFLSNFCLLIFNLAINKFWIHICFLLFIAKLITLVMVLFHIQYLFEILM